MVLNLITALLTPVGFVPTITSGTEELVLARRSGEWMFERFAFDFSGGRDKTIVGMDVSLVPGATALKGLSEYRTLYEIAANSRDGISSVCSAEELNELLARVLDVGLPVLKAWSADHGESLELGVTEPMRKRVSEPEDLRL